MLFKINLLINNNNMIHNYTNKNMRYFLVFCNIVICINNIFFLNRFYFIINKMQQYKFSVLFSILHKDMLQTILSET